MKFIRVIKAAKIKKEGNTTVYIIDLKNKKKALDEFKQFAEDGIITFNNILDNYTENEMYSYEIRAKSNISEPFVLDVDLDIENNIYRIEVTVHDVELATEDVLISQKFDNLEQIKKFITKAFNEGIKRAYYLNCDISGYRLIDEEGVFLNY